MKAIFAELLVFFLSTGCAQTKIAEQGASAAGPPTNRAHEAPELSDASSKALAKVEIPPVLAASPASQLALRLHAVGAQIYVCTAASNAHGTDGASYAWTLKAPEAVLYDETGKTVVGSHMAGPTWIYKDGSTVVGAKLAQEKAPRTDDIPWLLLRAVSHQGRGVLANVTYAQRVNTSKGKPPTTGCQESSLGREARAAYSADYYFYVGDDGPK